MMSNRLRIIMTFVTIMAVIFHGRLISRGYMPILYIQIAITISALVILIWRSYKWIDYGNRSKWHYDSAEMKDKVGFQEQIHIKLTGWLVFILALTTMAAALLSDTLGDFTAITHLPLVLLAIEFYIPYKLLMPQRDWQAIVAASRALTAQEHPPPSSSQYQADPVRYQQKSKSWSWRK